MLSVIILTFNSRGFIKPCLDSVFGQGYEDLEVIVVDNASRDGTADFIRANYPRAVLIENRENLGAARARNQGIEHSRGEWVLTLDCDTVLVNDFILKALRLIETLPLRIGMVQAKILRMDRKTVFSTGVYLSFFCRFFDIGRGQADNAKFSESRLIFGPCAAAAFYSRNMLEEIKEETGYFDERFFFLVEDVDLAWRAKRKGWKALYYPQAVCYHEGNGSRSDKKLRQYLCFRNRWLSIIKNQGLARYFIRLFPVLLYDIPRFFYLIFSSRHIIKNGIIKRLSKK